MKTSSKILAVLAMGAAMSAQAKPPGGCERGGEGGHSVTELVAKRSAHFMAMDLNGNGEVTREEIAEYRAKMREQRTGSRADRFERADTDKNGSVSAAEARAAAEAQLSKLDSNGDGELSRKEMRKGFKHGKRQAGPWADDQ
jgi:hypothetical protein